jgi:hypothetical protein
MSFFIYLIKSMPMIIKQKVCKHIETNKSSCPFTGLTYVTCVKCWKRISAIKTN